MRQNWKIKMKKLIHHFFAISELFPVKNNRILFTNYFGKSGYGCNLKYIAEEIHNQNLPVEMYWAVNDDKDKSFPDYIKPIRTFTLKWLWVMFTSKIWIDNQRKHMYVYKKSDQLYVQTWHGGTALKKIELDAVDSYNDKESYLQERYADNKMADIYISNSSWCSNMYRTAFDFHGTIIETGYPRNDILVNGDESIRKKVCKEFNISEDDYLILYAPTFRKNKGTEHYLKETEEFLNLVEMFKQINCRLLVRLHPNMADNKFDLAFNEKVINATNYSDIQELLLASDLLITDYSNVMFEFSYQRKPCILFAKDIEEYKNDRNFYFDYTSLPYPVAESLEQLINCVSAFEDEEYLEEYYRKLKVFFNSIGLCEDGNASKKVVKVLKDYLWMN